MLALEPLPTDEYPREFYERHAGKARSSAEAIVPLVMELVAPRSVVDLGCSVGTWLATFARHGVEDYVGVDDGGVPPELLEIPRDRFVSARLDLPITIERRFDLAISLEVAEHLPESAAKRFVDAAVRLAPCVLFSAAIPHQGGLHHKNEQWPEYWAALFARHGYAVVDSIRPRIWSAEGVDFWYKQNAFVYAREDVLAARPLLARDRAATVESMLPLVHPRLLSHVAANGSDHVRRPTARELSLAEVVHALPHIAARSLRWRLRLLLERLNPPAGLLLLSSGAF